MEWGSDKVELGNYLRSFARFRQLGCSQVGGTNFTIGTDWWLVASLTEIWLITRFQKCDGGGDGGNDDGSVVVGSYC